jgi:hypothetical protein
MLALKLLVLITLGVIIAQDMVSRAVYWIVFPLLLTLLGLLHYQIDRFGLWQPTLFNLGFLALQLLLLSLYFSVKQRRIVNIVDSLIGLGDVLFLFSLTVYFSVLSFLFFYILSLVFVLLFWPVCITMIRKRNKGIPLAGMQALLLIIFLSCDWGLKLFDLTADTWLLNLFTK